MDIERFLQEASQLARSCYYLRSDGKGTVKGVFGGKGYTKHPERRDHISNSMHWITVSCDLLEVTSLPLQGMMGVYEMKKYPWAKPFYVVHDADLTLSSGKIQGTPLYAQKTSSYPPFEAVCLYGSDSIARWMRSHDLERWEYDGLLDTEIANEYLDFYMQKFPLYMDNPPVAVVGGWPMRWENDDGYYAPPELRFLVLVLEGAEPWVEVFAIKRWDFPIPDFIIRDHIT